MCVDYTGLINKACPKDLYPLPHIDQIIDSATELLCVLDAYFGYQQIWMKRIRPTSYFVHYPDQSILLCHNAVRAKEHGGYLPALHETLCPHHKVLKGWRPYKRPFGDLRQSLEFQY